MAEESKTTQPRQRKVIPAPGELPDAKRDAARAFEALKAGGVIIVPTDVGYGMMAASVEAIERFFAAKKRKAGHSLGIIGTYNLHKKLHDLPEEKYQVAGTFLEEMGVTISVVGKMRENIHELLPSHLLPTLDKVTKNGTLAMAFAESPFHRELGRLNDLNGQIMIGSSANLTGQGQKFRVEDIEPEVLEAADLVIDYGRQKYHFSGRAGTILDLDNERVLRIGACYPLIAEGLTRWFGWSVPEDPDWDPNQKELGISIKREGGFKV
ncbi:hypothetical protein N7456_011987 [Penicillium angulare]|uniref:Threonylcarbamoyl-AMP synthase n=1 Tax=Penicillium angulare TaxID=116970 RepID=A0A9W9EUX2_9EURO|nr:hypothetical protein N7456_011987 [Penicillium angulare]